MPATLGLRVALPVFFGFTGCAGASADVRDGAGDVSIQTENGMVRGSVAGNLPTHHCAMNPFIKSLPADAGVAQFFAIPYAQPPVGALRFRPPQPAKPWSPKVLVATKPGAVCPQGTMDDTIKLPSWVPHAVTPGAATTEDCLTLNVWTTAPVPSRSNGLRPVLVYLHGGGFIGGNDYTMIGCPFYSGHDFAEDNGIVVVTLNYRLGSLGFTDLPELRAESGTSGNYGLQDQRLALEWVQRNIVAFGGDPARVTLMGESAGASSTMYHLVLPRSEGLFQRAIVQSGYDNTFQQSAASPEVRNAQFSSSRFRSALCRGEPNGEALLWCLRNATVDEVLNAQETVLGAADSAERLFHFAPVADGYELPEGSTLLDELKRRGRNRVPVLIGSNQNESSLFLCGLQENLPIEDAVHEVQHLVQALTGKDLADEVTRGLLDRYPVGTGGFPSQRSAIIGLATDLRFGCFTRHVANVLSQGEAPVYRYLLARSPAMFRESSACMGTPHSADVFYLFADIFKKALPPAGAALWDAGDDAVIANMTSAWSAFIHGNAPMESTKWPEWRSSDESLLQIDAVPKVVRESGAAACKALEAAGILHPLVDDSVLYL